MEKEDIFKLEDESIILDLDSTKKVTLYVRGFEDVKSKNPVEWNEFYIQEPKDVYNFKQKYIDPVRVWMNGQWYGKWIINKEKRVLLTFEPHKYIYPDLKTANKILSENDLDTLAITCVENFCLKYNQVQSEEAMTVFVGSFDDFFIRTNYPNLYQRKNENKVTTQYTIDSKHIFSAIGLNNDKKFDIISLKETIDLFKMRFKNRVSIGVIRC